MYFDTIAQPAMVSHMAVHQNRSFARSLGRRWTATSRTVGESTNEVAGIAERSAKARTLAADRRFQDGDRSYTPSIFVLSPTNWVAVGSSGA